jgi:hypothetical protein
VTVVGLGCNNFGRRLDAGQTATVVHAALDAGITFFDTADIYGGTRSEEFLGSALGKRRDEVVIATKFGMAVDDRRRGAHPDYVGRAAEDSLRRLGTDRIDLYQLHTPDPDVPIADTLGALDQLVWDGKVREIGCSNFSVPQLREAGAALDLGLVAALEVRRPRVALRRAVVPHLAAADRAGRIVGGAGGGGRTGVRVAWGPDHSLAPLVAALEVRRSRVALGLTVVPHLAPTLGADGGDGLWRGGGALGLLIHGRQGDGWGRSAHR